MNGADRPRRETRERRQPHSISGGHNRYWRWVRLPRVPGPALGFSAVRKRYQDRRAEAQADRGQSPNRRSDRRRLMDGPYSRLVTWPITGETGCDHFLSGRGQGIECRCRMLCRQAGGRRCGDRGGSFDHHARRATASPCGLRISSPSMRHAGHFMVQPSAGVFPRLVGPSPSFGGGEFACTGQILHR